MKVIRFSNRVIRDGIRALIFRIYSFFHQRPGIKKPMLLVLEFFPSIKEAIKVEISTPIGCYSSFTRSSGCRTDCGKRKNRTIFIDVSNLVRIKGGTGIPRVTLKISEMLLLSPPGGYAIVPVYSTTKKPGFYRTSSTQSILCNHRKAPDAFDIPVIPGKGDLFLGLDFCGTLIVLQRHCLEKMIASGVRVFFIVYDLLPINFPGWFPPCSGNSHETWLRSILNFSGVLCISQKVKNDLEKWIVDNNIVLNEEFRMDWFHLGGDFLKLGRKNPELEIPFFQKTFSGDEPVFLMVGTVEPRKGHSLILEAFENLWRKGERIKLLIIGKEGWMVGDLSKRIRRNIFWEKYLFWEKSVDDEILQFLYQKCTVLVAASEDEGFGLPIVEALNLGLPVIARDIPVFREVSGGCASFFEGSDATDVAYFFSEWLRDFSAGRIFSKSALKTLTWKDSAAILMDKILQ